MRKVNLWNEAVNDLFGFYNYHSYIGQWQGTLLLCFLCYLRLSIKEFSHHRYTRVKTL